MSFVTRFSITALLAVVVVFGLSIDVTNTNAPLVVGASTAFAATLPPVPTLPEIGLPPKPTLPEVELPEVDLPAVKTCKITASAQVVPSGSKVTIGWDTAGYDTITINGEQVSGAKGSKTYTVNSDTTYRLVAKTKDGQTCTGQVTVLCVAPPPPPTQPVAPNCPYTPKSGRTIVDFTNVGVVTNENSSIRSDRTLAESRSNVIPVDLSAGRYNVSLFAWDGYNGRENVTQANERYQVAFLAQGQTVATSNATRDLADKIRVATVNQQVNSNFSLPSAVTSVRADHAAYPDKSSAHSLVPLCAAFDRIPDPEPEPKPVCTLDVSPSSVVSGGDVKLTWTTKNADTVSFNHGIGSVAKNGNRTETVTAATTYVLTATGKGGTVKCEQPVTIKTPTPKPAPLCTLDVSKSVVKAGGEDVELTWTTKNADTVSMNRNIGSVDKNGKRTVFVNTSATFVLTATGEGGTVQCSKPVTVKQPPSPKPAPECTLALDPSQLGVGGGDVKLTWTTKNADTASFNEGIGVVAVNGTRTESVTTSKTFILTVTGKGGTVTCDKPVTVDVKPPTKPAPECTMTGTPTTLGIGGGDVKLAWTTKNADTVTLNENIGTVAKNGNRTVSTTVSKTYILTATGEGGSVQCPVPVTVPNTPAPLTCEDVSFTSSATRVSRNSDVTLSWNLGNRVTSASIDQNIGTVGKTGSRTVRITSATTYTMTIKNAQSEQSCPVTISIQSSGGGGGGSVTPRCELDLSKTRITAGESVLLNWDTRNATHVEIRDNHGRTLLDTDRLADRRAFDGEQTLRPTQNTTYTLTATRGSRDRVCTAALTTGDTVTVTEVRDQPLVAGISLTQVPYTGFEAGTFLTIIFYTLLTLWALFIAYLFVIRRDSIAGVALPGAFGGTPMVDMSREASPETGVSPAETYVASVTAPAAPTAAAPANLPVANLPIAEVATPAVVGYQNYVAPQTEEEVALAALENRAHAQKALLSSDAMRYLIHTEQSLEERAKKLDAVIRVAKVTFPTEDGWIVLNLVRMEALLGDLTQSEEAAVVADAAPVTSGSLAEAVVTGNVVAAFAMIQNRPMIALADAAADLDAVYRARKGEQVAVSDLLQNSTAALTDEQLSQAISALTSAIDGTYANEAEAVKMAIMKAVKVVA